MKKVRILGINNQFLTSIDELNTLDNNLSTSTTCPNIFLSLVV